MRLASPFYTIECRICNARLEAFEDGRLHLLDQHGQPSETAFVYLRLLVTQPERRTAS